MKVNKTRSLAHSIAWNLAGAGIPLIVAIVSIPLLLAGYGSARFGFLTICWAMIGYFSIFDFGIGRALTKIVADRLSGVGKSEIPDISYTGLSAMCVLGLVTCLVLMPIAPWLIDLLNLDVSLKSEAVISLRILAASIPLVIISAGLIGILEAHALFRSINSVRLIMGVLNFTAPLLILNWSHSLVPATLSLAGTRLVTGSIYYLMAKRVGVIGAGTGSFKVPHLRELLRYGGWIAFSNLISPLMAQLDKVVVGGIVALALLPFYSIPNDMINRLSFAPLAVVGVFFPVFASSWAGGHQSRFTYLFKQAGKAMFAASLPASLIVFAFAHDGLARWLTVEFADQAAPLLRWLSIGFFLNCLARIPHAALQASGRPDLTAKLHLLELPLYAVGLWALLDNFGILGASIAWTARMALDLILLVICAGFVFPFVRRAIYLALIVVFAAASAIACIAFVDNLWLRLMICVALTLGGIGYSFQILLRLNHEK